MVGKIFQKYSADSFFLNAPLITNALIALAIFPIILANLSIADYGKFQFVLALQIWLSALTANNITVASKRGIAKGLNGTFLYAFLARLKLLVPAGIFVIGVAFYIKVLGYYTFSILLAIIGLYLVFSYLFQISFYEFLIAKKRFKEWFFWQILISFISMIGSALAAFFTKNIIYFALVQLGSISILSLIAWLWIVTKERLIESYKKGQIDKECFPYGLKLIPVDLITITAGRISHFIIGPFFGFGNLAVFSVAYRLRDKCAGILKSVRPLLYADFATLEREELIKIVNRHLFKIGALGILLTVGFIGLGWFYIRFFLPEAYGRTTFYFTILAFGLPPGILAMLLHTILESHLRYKELTVIGIITNLLRILLVVVLGYLWQIIGVCIALAISGWISFGFYYYLTLKKDFTKRKIGDFPLLEKLLNT